MFNGSNSLNEKLGSKLDNSEQAIRKKSDNFAHSKQKSDCLHEESNLQNDIMNQVEHGPFIKIINKPTFVVVSDANDSESSMFWDSLSQDNKRLCPSSSSSENEKHS